MALEQLDRADITTIHGFCRRSLRRQALVLGGAAMDAQLETDTTVRVQEVVQEIWRELLQTLNPEQLSGLREG